MILLMAGENTFQRQEDFDALRAKYNQDGALATNTITLDGARTTLAELRVAAQTVPFLADYRLVRVDGLAARLTRGGRRRGAGGEWTGLADCLADVPSTTLLVFLDEKLTGRNNPLQEAVEGAGGEVRNYPDLRAREVDDWVADRARSLDLHITTAGRRQLLQRVGPDLWVLARELEKLRLYAGDDAVDDTIVSSLVPAGFDTTIWQLVDGVAEQRPTRALQALDSLRLAGEDMPRVISLLARQFRMISVACEVLDRGGGESELQSALGVQSFVARRAMAQAKRYDQAGADAALARVLEADLAIQHFRRARPGGMHHDLAAELLVGELAHGRAPRGA